MQGHRPLPERPGRLRRRRHRRSPVASFEKALDVARAVGLPGRVRRPSRSTRSTTLDADAGPEFPSWIDPTLEAPPTRGTTMADQLKAGLNAPICLTWEWTYACNLQCVHCLSSSGTRDPHELTTDEMKAIVDDLHDLGVFYVNIGGGEPMLRPDFFEVVEYCVRAGRRREVLDQRRPHDGRQGAPPGRAWTTSTCRSASTASTTPPTTPCAARAATPRPVRAMDHLRDAGFGPFKISVVMTRDNVEQLDGFEALADGLRRRAAPHPLPPLGPRRRQPWHELHPTQDQQRTPLPLAARAAARAHRRLVLPPVGARRGAARAEPVRRRPGGLPHRPGRRRLRLPVRAARRVQGRVGPRRRAASARCGPARRSSPSCASRSRPAPAPRAAATTPARAGAWPPSSSPGCRSTAPTPSA